jgi:hypothetical protein
MCLLRGSARNHRSSGQSTEPIRAEKEGGRQTTAPPAPPRYGGRRPHLARDLLADHLAGWGWIRRSLQGQGADSVYFQGEEPSERSLAGLLLVDEGDMASPLWQAAANSSEGRDPTLPEPEAIQRRRNSPHRDISKR